MRRIPRESQFYDRFVELAGYLQDGNLVLAELSGIPVEQRRSAAERMQEICDAADAAAGAVLRRLRENYITPLDRQDLLLLSELLRSTCHALDGVGFAMTSSAFGELPVGALEMLALLSTQADQTQRMTQRLRGKPDQWEYVETMDRLYQRSLSLQQQISDAVPASRQGLTYVAAAMQLSAAFVEAARSYREIGRIVGVIAVKES
ncbi:hypothetical protein GCM10022261_06960 [Brevibacterium daeguense]|uniref:Phosphate transport regulator n=1 Tax=Brevibacterium daeguense TaxID=909936 RepID=A0ABP8EGU5_9MICO|nr:DUF47 domain-containing protein [Brevibacterium daeguense]